MPRELWSEPVSSISCVHGDEKLYPISQVYLTVGGLTYLLTVVSVPTLPYPAVLGHDVPTLLDLIEQTRRDKQSIREQHVGEWR